MIASRTDQGVRHGGGAGISSDSSPRHPRVGRRNDAWSDAAARAQRIEARNAAVGSHRRHHRVDLAARVSVRDFSAKGPHASALHNPNRSKTSADHHSVTNPQ